MDKKLQICEAVDRLGAELVAMSDDIYDHPELGLNEYYASKLLGDYLKQNGFSVQSLSLPTAFRAEYEIGTGGPAIGLLCEYDALPDFGHGCAHHMQGPAILGAAMALKECLGADTPVKIIIYGTPDEEHTDGKIQMLDAGEMHDIDIALMTHAGSQTNVDVKSLAMYSYTAEFHGVKSHAALMPEAGRSAVDAMLLMFQGIEFLREHVKDDTRMHYAIRETSPSSNVVPDYASAGVVTRSYSAEYLDDLEHRLRDIVKGAALMTGTTSEIAVRHKCQDKIPALRLNGLLMNNAERIGAPGLAPPREKTGSTDFGNVVHRIPGAVIRVQLVPPGTSSHSREFLEAGKGEAAKAAVLNAAKILAMTCFDLASSPETVEAVKEEFRQNLAQRL